MSLDEFRRRFPLGSTRRVVALSPEGRYAGIVPVSAVYARADGAESVGSLVILAGHALKPEMNIKTCMAMFDQTESDELAVVDDSDCPLGVLSEAYATRRYAEELEKVRRDLVGGD